MKHILFFIVAFYSGLCLQAQDSLKQLKKPYSRSNQFYFYAGPSLVSIRGVQEKLSGTGQFSYNIDRNVQKTGYSVGIGLIRDMSKHFQVQTKLLWERKGQKGRSDSVYISPYDNSVSISPLSTTDISNDYLTLSVVPELKIGKHPHITIGLGGYVSVLQKSKVTNEIYHPILHYNYSSGDFKKYDYGFTLIAGYSFIVQRKLAFTLQVTKSYGLYQVRDWFTWIQNPPGFYNDTYSFLVGIKFASKKKISCTNPLIHEY